MGGWMCLVHWGVVDNAAAADGLCVCVCVCVHSTADLISLPSALCLFCFFFSLDLLPHQIFTFSEAGGWSLILACMCANTQKHFLCLFPRYSLWLCARQELHILYPPRPTSTLSSCWDAAPVLSPWLCQKMHLSGTGWAGCPALVIRGNSQKNRTLWNASSAELTACFLRKDCPYSREPAFPALSHCVLCDFIYLCFFMNQPSLSTSSSLFSIFVFSFQPL